MKYFLVVLLSAWGRCCSAQLSKPVSISAAANFNVVIKGLGTNDAGFGAGIDGLFFSKNKLAALLETNAVRFVGDKLLVIDPATGERAGSGVIYAIKAGPQFFLSRNLALAATYGPVWHRIRDFRYTHDGGIQISLTGYLGQRKNAVVKVFFTALPAGERPIRYAGAAAGFRF